MFQRPTDGILTHGPKDELTRVGQCRQGPLDGWRWFTTGSGVTQTSARASLELARGETPVGSAFGRRPTYCPKSVCDGEVCEVEPFRVAVRVDDLDTVVNLPGRRDLPAAVLNILEELRQWHVTGSLGGSG